MNTLALFIASLCATGSSSTSSENVQVSAQVLCNLILEYGILFCGELNPILLFSPQNFDALSNNIGTSSASALSVWKSSMNFLIYVEAGFNYITFHVAIYYRDYQDQW
jgi:hypothetical protein